LLSPGAGVLFENIIDVYTGIQIELQPKFSYFADFYATKKDRKPGVGCGLHRYFLHRIAEKKANPLTD
jgi:hypothetical protein